MRILSVLLFLALSFRAEAANLDLLAAGGKGGWVNTERPLTAEDLKGRVILLDFWTYGCINCIQVVPDLIYLEKKFPQLLVIGVHSAKFKNESGSDRIRAAAARFGITHPVMNDSDFAVWDSFDVRAWPTFVLLDGAGKEISRYAGEGRRAQLERDIEGVIAKTAAEPVRNVVMKKEESGVLSFPSHFSFAPDTPQGPLIFVGDGGHNRILGFSPDGRVKVTIGGSAAGRKDGSFSEALLNRPHGTAYRDGMLYIADTDNHVLRKADLAAGTVTTVAGDGRRGRQFASPWDVEFLPDGRLAIAMAGTHRLEVFDPANGKTIGLAGNGHEGIDDDDADDATLAQPSGLSLAGDVLYFVDAESSALRALRDGQVKTLVGTGLFDFGFVDGKYPQAMTQHPQGVFAAGDKAYIADTYNNAIRVYDAASGVLATLKIEGETLLEPGDIHVQGGVAYIADTGHHRIVAVDLKSGAARVLQLTP